MGMRRRHQRRRLCRLSFPHIPRHRRQPSLLVVLVMLVLVVLLNLWLPTPYKFRHSSSRRRQRTTFISHPPPIHLSSLNSITSNNYNYNYIIINTIVNTSNSSPSLRTRGTLRPPPLPPLLPPLLPRRTYILFVFIFFLLSYPIALQPSQSVFSQARFRLPPHLHHPRSPSSQRPSHLLCIRL